MLLGTIDWSQYPTYEEGAPWLKRDVDWAGAWDRSFRAHQQGSPRNKGSTARLGQMGRWNPKAAFHVKQVRHRLLAHPRRPLPPRNRTQARPRAPARIGRTDPAHSPKPRTGRRVPHRLVERTRIPAPTARSLPRRPVRHRHVGRPVVHRTNRRRCLRTRPRDPGPKAVRLRRPQGRRAPRTRTARHAVLANPPPPGQTWARRCERVRVAAGPWTSSSNRRSRRVLMPRTQAQDWTTGVSPWGPPRSRTRNPRFLQAARLLIPQKTRSRARISPFHVKRCRMRPLLQRQRSLRRLTLGNRRMPP